MSLFDPVLRPPAPSSLASATPLPRVLRPQRALPSAAVRPTRAEINLAALRHNLRVLQRVAGGARVWCVLKADAYGHGAKGVARTLERAGASGICVALLEEGIELREAGIRVPILVMGGYYGRAWGELLHHELTPMVHDLSQIEPLAEEVRYSGGRPLPVHLKVDTGMARLGLRAPELTAAAALLRAHPELQLEGLMTHFACADSSDPASLDEQLDRFELATATLAAEGLVPRLRHAANSAALLSSPRATLDCVRAGIALFGVSPRPGMTTELHPVMRVQTELIAIRELQPGDAVGYGSTWRATRRSRIATLPMGYADGLSRSLSNQGHVLVRGQRAPIAGTVSMDLTMVDVTDIEGARPGDEVVVLGEQHGKLGHDRITAEELAGHSGSIAWEVLTHISRRVPRFYREP